MFVFLIILINAPFYLRNYRLTGNIIGDSAISSMMKNESVNKVFLASNILKNINLHIGLHIDNYCLFIDKIVKKIAKEVTIDKNI